jgi:hypothetical protein
MGNFLAMLLQFAESFLAQNAGLIEQGVIAEIEAAAGSLFKTVTAVKTTGAAPAAVQTPPTVLTK